MADFDPDPFEEHEYRPDEPTDESIPLTPVGRSTLGPDREQEMSFGEESGESEILNLFRLGYFGTI